MTLALAKRMRLRSANFRFKNMFGRRIRRKTALRSHIPFAIPKSCTHLDLNFLYISILRTYT